MQVTDAQLVHLSEAEAEAVVTSYQTLARQVAAFPPELREIEPALLSLPGPARE